jgi:hypothetical protein
VGSNKFSVITILKVLPISKLGMLIQAELMILMGKYGTEFLDKKKLRYVIWAAINYLSLPYHTQSLTNIKAWHVDTDRIDDFDGHIWHRVLVSKSVTLLTLFAYPAVSHQQPHLHHWIRTVVI